MFISLSEKTTNGSVADLGTINPFGTLIVNDTFSTDVVSAANGTSTQKFLSAPPVITITDTTTKVIATASVITPPTISVVTGSSFLASGSTFVSGVSISDNSVGSAIVSVNIADTNGLLSVAGNPGVSITGANSNNVTLTGSLSSINAALKTLVDTSSVVGSDTLTFTYTDQPAHTTATAYITETVTAPLVLSGLTTNATSSDISTSKPFSNLVLTDNVSAADNLSTTIAFTAANGTLNGMGLSAGSIAGSVISYSLSAASPAILQQELNSLIFTPTVHEVATGLTVTTNFTLSVSGAGSGNTSPVNTITNNSVLYDSIAITTDASGDVFVSAYGGVTEYSATGALIQSLTMPNQYIYYNHFAPVVSAIDSSGNLFVAYYINYFYPSVTQFVAEYSAAGTLVQTIAIGNLSYGQCLATDSNGNLFVGGNGLLTEYSASGTLLRTMSVPSNITALALATDKNSNVFALSGNAVYEFSPTGVALHKLTTGNSGASAIATDGNGDIFIAYSNNTVTEYSSTGALLRNLTTGVFSPTSLATDINGNVFVSNNNSTVTVYSASGRLLKTLTNTSGLLSTDALGNLYVVNVAGINGYTLKKFAPYLSINSITDASSKITVTAAAIMAPNVTAVSELSDNINSNTIAKAGNIITESFKVDSCDPTNDPIASVGVTIDGKAATVVHGSGNNYTATYTVKSGDTNGLVNVAITATDIAGNTITLNPTATVTIFNTLVVNGVAAGSVVSTLQNSNITSITVTDSSANIVANIDSLESNIAKISGITLSDSNSLSISASQLSKDASVLALISGNYKLVITDTASHLNGLNLSANSTLGLSPDSSTLLVTFSSGATTSIPYGNGSGSVVLNGITIAIGNLEAQAKAAGAVVVPVFTENAGGTTAYLLPTIYTGPASLHLNYQLIDATQNAEVTGSTSNDFIKLANTNSTGKAVNGGGGSDVIDGGVGTTFITGGAGHSGDTFFLDGRAPGISWPTITDFVLGSDQATIWGFVKGVSSIDSTIKDTDTSGAAGYTGLTLHFNNLLPDGQTSGSNSSLNSITLSGHTLSDLGVSSIAQLNSEIANAAFNASTGQYLINSHILIGQTQDSFGAHSYLWVH